jgi:hypothetical protein
MLEIHNAPYTQRVNPLPVACSALVWAAMATSGFVTGDVTACDGICDGLSFPKYLIIKDCDDVTAENP